MNILPNPRYSEGVKQQSPGFDVLIEPWVTSRDGGIYPEGVAQGIGRRFAFVQPLRGRSRDWVIPQGTMSTSNPGLFCFTPSEKNIDAGLPVAGTRHHRIRLVRKLRGKSNCIHNGSFFEENLAMPNENPNQRQWRSGSKVLPPVKLEMEDNFKFNENETTDKETWKPIPKAPPVVDPSADGNSDSGSEPDA